MEIKKNKLLMALIIIGLLLILIFLSANNVFGFFGRAFARVILPDNPHFCKIIINEEKREACYWSTVSKPSHITFCAVQPDALKDGCYQKIAYSSQDESVCAEISINNQIDCFAEVAIMKRDLRICEGLNSLEEKLRKYYVKECYAYFYIRVPGSTIAMCEKSSTEELKQYCRDAASEIINA